MNESRNIQTNLTQFDYDLIIGCITRGVPAFSNELIMKFDRVVFENEQLKKELSVLKDSIAASEKAAASCAAAEDTESAQ